MTLNKIWGVASVCILASLIGCGSAPTESGGCTTNCTPCTSNCSPPPPIPTATMSSNPLSVTAGGSVVIAWSCTNVTSCSTSLGDAAMSGTRTVMPTATTTYTVDGNGPNGPAHGSVTVTVTAPPTWTLRVNAQVWYGQPAFSNLRIWISSPSGSLKDSADVQSDGSATFTSAIAAQIMAGDSVIRTVDVVGTNPRQFMPRISRLSTAEFASRTTIGLLSLTPAYNLGVYAGKPISFSLENGAYVPSNDGEMFYWKYDFVVNGVHFQKYDNPHWASFPNKWAIGRDPSWHSTYSMTASDSTSMAQGLAQLKQYYGFDWYNAANPSDVSRTSGYVEIVDSTVSVDSNGNPTGASAISGWNTDADGNIVAASTAYGHQYTAVYAPAVMHEAVHSDGRGNGCGWHGIESTGCGSGWAVSSFPIAEDVVYGMLVHKVCDFQKQTGDRFIFAESDQGERVRMLNLPEQKIWRGDSGC